MESSSSPCASPDWVRSPRGRKELFFIGGFVLLNLLLPLLIVDLYPFSRAPMFADAPQLYCEYHVYGPDGKELHLKRPDGRGLVLVFDKPLPALGLHRNYWGNPIGAGVGFLPPSSVDEFGTIASREQVTAHLQRALQDPPELAFVEVVQQVIGDVDGQRAGVIEEKTQRWRVDNPAYQGGEKP